VVHICSELSFFSPNQNFKHTKGASRKMVSIESTLFVLRLSEIKNSQCIDAFSSYFPQKR